MEPDHSEEEMLQGAIQDNAIRRLKKIEGQVAGLRRMVEEPKYCVDILQQVAAVQGALTQVSKVVIGDHLRTCVAEAMQTGGAESDRVIEELENVFARYARQ